MNQDNTIPKDKSNKDMQDSQDMSKDLEPPKKSQNGASNHWKIIAIVAMGAIAAIVIAGVVHLHGTQPKSSVSISQPTYSVRAAEKLIEQDSSNTGTASITQKSDSGNNSNAPVSSACPSGSISGAAGLAPSGNTQSTATVPLPSAAALPILPSITTSTTEETPNPAGSSSGTSSAAKIRRFGTGITSESIGRAVTGETVISLNFVFKNAGDSTTWTEDSQCTVFQGKTQLSLISEKNADINIQKGQMTSVCISYQLNDTTTPITVRYQTGKGLAVKTLNISRSR